LPVGRRRGAVQLHTIGVHRPLDVLELFLAEIDKFSVDPPAHVLVSR
jgi:hypothetical protein